MAYKSKNEKMRAFFDRYVIPEVTKRDVNEEQMTNLIFVEFNIQKKRILEYIDALISTRRIKRVMNYDKEGSFIGSVLTIPDEQVDDWLSKHKEQEAMDKKNIIEVDEVISKLNKNGKQNNIPK